MNLPEVINQVCELLSTSDLLSLALVSRYHHAIALPHIYANLVLTDAYALSETQFAHYGSIITQKRSFQLLKESLEANALLLTLIQLFICDVPCEGPIIQIFTMISHKLIALKKLEYPQKWFELVVWNINSNIVAKKSLRNILTPSLDDVVDLAQYPTLTLLKVLESPISHVLERPFSPKEIVVLENLRSLAIEDSQFAKRLAQLFGLLRKLHNLETFTYKIDCLATFKRDRFDFETLEQFLSFSSLRNFKLVVWYTENIEPFVQSFLKKLSANLATIENFELKRSILGYNSESHYYNSTFTLTNGNYKTFFKANLSSLKVLQFSGNYLNRSFIRENNPDLFTDNFSVIFESCPQLKVLIIDKFINLKNSSQWLRFLYDSVGDKELSRYFRDRIRKLASFGYLQFFIDSFDDEFDENVDCTEYDLIKFVCNKLRANYMKFSSLDDPSNHFFKYDNGWKKSFLHRINYIKSLEDSIDFHTEFFHHQKAWKLSEKCSCTKQDYKLIVDLLAALMGDYIEVLAHSLLNLELVILNGIFYQIDDQRRFSRVFK